MTLEHVGQCLGPGSRANNNEVAKKKKLNELNATKKDAIDFFREECCMEMLLHARRRKSEEPWASCNELE